MNQRRVPSGASEGSISVLVGFLIVAAGVAATCVDSARSPSGKGLAMRSSSAKLTHLAPRPS
jgi:hypothetical protein